ncbi:DUF4494 family protein [Clavibacter sp.]|uniref:DUF4494 family protein n=1 Tax=Clavibacter sp. TaxID=1871044 RepID=UPI001984A53F|nr:DUF4494 family protein [Clavibacter sp.]MBD5381994.1 DUF4494 domain-containing protein [Clavibacter sp.]
MFYEITIQRQGHDDGGKEKKFTEKYLIEALSITEATIRFEEEISEFFPDHETKSVKRINYSEVLTDDDEDNRYFHAVYNVITPDERTGKERKSAVSALIQASTFDVAKYKYEEMIRGYLADVELVKITETKILDYFSKII